MQARQLLNGAPILRRSTGRTYAGAYKMRVRGDSQRSQSDARQIDIDKSLKWRPGVFRAILRVAPPTWQLSGNL